MANLIPVFRGGQQSAYQLNKRIAALRKLSPSTAATAPVNAIAASLATALTGTNNDLDFTAKVKGAAGNDITITYVNPGVETATESVAVTGSDIVVTLRRVSSVLSTAAQVQAAIEANAEANALVSVENHSTDTGASSVIAMSETPLAGGVDGTPGEAWEQRYNGGYLYLHASDAAGTVSTANWKKWSVSAA
jgi:hypothetical protein